MSLIDLTPEYNLLEDYEQNDLVISVIDDLKLFFQSSKCSCCKTSEDLQNCFEKIGFKNFFERYFEFKSLNKNEKIFFSIIKYNKNTHVKKNFIE